ncbi:tyrosine-type recombinase/integrase [Geothrix terrae]|uniref:tyrosine-type recombinase/integrase n=1 Tax=Geothrix terrae TaxID=2922720 RepID=UPI001FADF206|nr:site-specific integrase [Geothrix terrae]
MGYYRPKQGGAGTWSARLYDPVSKKIARKSIGTADDYTDADDRDVFSYAQAQAKAREWFEEARADFRGEPIRRGPFTVKDAWEAYAEDAERRGMKSLPQTGATVRAHILPAFGNMEVSDLTQYRVEKWHQKLAEAPARRRTKKGADEHAHGEDPITPDVKRARRASANRVLGVLKAMLSFAKRRRLTKASGEAWREVAPFRGTVSARQRFLNPDEAQRLVNACDPEFRLLVQAALLTGARFGELTRIRVSDFNEMSKTIFFELTKNSKPRYVYLTEEGLSFFRSLTAGKRGDQALFLRDSYSNRNRNSEKILRPWRKSEASRPMAEACEAAGLEAMTFHELRHTYASGLVNRGVPLAYVAAQLGHTDTRMVEKHYGHICHSALAEAIDKLAPTWGILDTSNVANLEIKKSG